MSILTMYPVLGYQLTDHSHLFCYWLPCPREGSDGGRNQSWNAGETLRYVGGKAAEGMQESCPGEERCAGVALSGFQQTAFGGGRQDTPDSASCSSPALLPEKQSTLLKTSPSLTHQPLLCLQQCSNCCLADFRTYE